VPEDPLHDRIADDPSQALVAHVVCAEHIAVQQQHTLAVYLGDRAVLDQRRAGFPAEPLANQEITVAVHDETGDPGVRQGAQRLHDRVARGCRIVVAEPDLEQVAQDVERAGRACLASRKAMNCAWMPGEAGSRCRSDMKRVVNIAVPGRRARWYGAGARRGQRLADRQA